MGFAARYDKRSKYLNDIDELIIPFHDKPDNLAEFLEEHSKQRIILDLRDGWKNFFGAILQPVWESHQNLAIRLPNLTPEVVESIKKTKIPFFSKEISVEWELFYKLANFGVSDIYVSEQLGFEMQDVGAAAAKYGMMTRVFPNIAQSALDETDSLKRFFIRPEDAALYNRRYVSIFEFYIPEDLDLNWDVLYRAYAIDKKWMGPLQEIILNLDSDIDNIYIYPYWGEYRMNCKRSCLKAGSCTMCHTLYNLSRSFNDIQIMPVRSKDAKMTAKEQMISIDNKAIDAEEPTEPPVIPNF